MTSPIRFGIQTPPWDDWPTMLSRWRRFEAMGWDSLWLPDHFLPTFRRERPFFEAWTLLAALAGGTTTARIGVLVSCNTFRLPALLAKEAVTVDHISNGRLELGIGTGWVEFEHTMFGIPYPDGPERVAMYAEAIEVIDRLMRNEVSSYAGQFYQLDEAHFRPGPVQKPRPPMTLAAHGPKMLKLIAPYVDRWNSMGSPDEMRERSERLSEALLAAGREPRDVLRSVLYVPSVTPDERPWDSEEAFLDFVGRYREAGMGEVILQPPPDEHGELFERVSREHLPRLREAAGV